MKVVEHHTPDELCSFYEQETNPRQSKRIWIVWQARLGKTEPQITSAVGMSRRAVQSWVQRYNRHGLDGLLDRPGRGRKLILSDEERQLVAEWMSRRSQSEIKDSIRGVDIQQFISQQFGKQLSLSAIYDLWHRLGCQPLQRENIAKPLG